ncbi:GAF domain-containing sensor histidine kinase [Actinoallomurus acaciae]|uniref:histidine kinase n=1 Tax=Actinoallomurus acaciae TaxID=502577 RepID=A0ABV5YT87_9ACTN
MRVRAPRLALSRTCVATVAFLPMSGLVGDFGLPIAQAVFGEGRARPSRAPETAAVSAPRSKTLEMVLHDDWVHQSRAVWLPAGLVVIIAILASLSLFAFLTRGSVRPTPGGRAGGMDPLERHALLTLSASLRRRDDEAHRTQATHQAQAALRRVATLVARGVPPQETFSAVAGEMGRLVGPDHVTLQRFEPDDTVRAVGHWSAPDAPQIMPPLDGHWPNEEGTVGMTVLRTGRPARMTISADVTTEIGSWLWSKGICYVVSCPIWVEGRIWGTMTVLSRTEPPPVVTEARMADFVELIGTAIANSQARAELLASRARVVAASDETRHRIERNLHDGVQQRLIALGFEVRSAEAALSQEALRGQLASIGQEIANILGEVREISRGLHPAILSKGGLETALRTLGRRSAVPVKIDINLGRRLPEPVEIAVYYIVSEALANASKHANASLVIVDLRENDGAAWVSVHDDGVGGADLGGSGLIGLKDRVESLGGSIQVDSPAGKGTSLLAILPTDKT